MRLGYYSMIDLIDDEVGRVINHLEQTCQLKNTLVIFTSDHGDMLGDNKLLVKGAFFYDPCVKVPLLVHWPENLNKGQKISTPVQNFDLAATILQAAGFDKKTCNELMPDSQNLLEMGNGSDEPFRDYAICRYRNTGIRSGNKYWDPEIHGTMIRTEKWKLCYYHSTNEGELYNLENDPNETVNLWGQPEHESVTLYMLDQLKSMVSKEEFIRPPRGGETLPAPNILLNNNRSQLRRNTDSISAHA